MRTDAINWFASSELCRSLQDGGKTPLTQCSAGKSKKVSSASRNAPYFYARTRALGRQIWWFVTLLFAVLVITSTINEYNVPNVVEVRPVTTDD